MPATHYPDINELLDTLLSQIQTVLSKKLVGFYLYGSLVWGDFDYEISDLDLLAATSSDVDDEEFHALNKMHDDFATKYKKWNDRIEVQYLSLHGLKTFKTQSSKMSAISPGDRFHVIDAGRDWLMNWYFVQENGITLFGPLPGTIIEPISKEEFIRAVQEHAKTWREYVYKAHTRPAQAYAILTMCRALYTLRHGEQVSKKQAALWAEKELPAWATLIQNALLWREARDNAQVEHDVTLPETVRFVHFVISLMNIK